MRWIVLMAFVAVSSSAQAQMPEDACYAMRLSTADLAVQPARGVRELFVHFIALTAFDDASKGPWRHVRIAARMAEQGQAVRDHAAGALLIQTATCRTARLSCWTDDNRTHFDMTMHSAAQMELRTSDFPVADYGESLMASNLAEHTGRESIYLLSRLNNGPCPVE